MAPNTTPTTDSLYHAHAEDFEKGLASPAKLEDAPPAPRKRFLFWRLPKKQWFWALGGTCVVIVGVVLLIVFLAIVPALFQKYADKVTLSVNHLDISSFPTDPNSHVVDVDISIRVDYDASMSATMDEASATLYFDEKPFGVVTLPETKLSKHNKSFDLAIRQSAEIQDVAVFRSLSRALITQENVTITTRAKVKAHAMGLSYGGIKLNRDITVKAFNQFRDPVPEVNTISFSECTSKYYKLVLNVTLDNNSQVGIGGIGAINVSVFHDQHYLGQAVTTDPTLGLPRGNTTLSLDLMITKDAKTAATVVGLANALLGGKIQLYVTGNNPGATKAVLLDEAFKALNLSIPYTDGLSKLAFGSTCDLSEIVTSALG